MRKLLYFLPLLFIGLTSCLGNDDDIDYTEWRKQNDDYVTKMEALTENGEKVYTKITEDWAPQDFCLVKWHNDRKLTEKNLVAMSNSTVNIKYEMEDIEGNYIGDSYSTKDSVYQSQPNQNIVGMWLAMINLHEGDSVTLIIPSNSGYGYSYRDPIKPFSTLIYHMKLKKVVKYD